MKRPADDKPCRCKTNGPLVTCLICGLHKPPLGRSVAPEAANGMCSHDCQGYAEDPCPGVMWPGEDDEDMPRHRS